MAIFKANYVKRGKTEKSLAKATIRYIQHRRGKDGHTITRDLFNADGTLTRYEAYRIIDEAAKGSFFYRFVLSPDPKNEDRKHDLDMREIAMRTMVTLEERLGTSILWVGAVHDDHAPHLHAHLVAVVPTRLTVADLEALRERTTEAALEQRHYLDLLLAHERERPYPLPTFADTDWENPAVYPRYTKGTLKSPGLKYASLGHSSYARREAKRQQTKAFWHTPRGRPLRELTTCVCPRCQSVHVHNTRDPVHQCSCGLILHRQKQRTLSLSPERKGAGWGL
jgi:hypothetical protein